MLIFDSAAAANAAAALALAAIEPGATKPVAFVHHSKMIKIDKKKSGNRESCGGK